MKRKCLGQIAEEQRKERVVSVHAVFLRESKKARCEKKCSLSEQFFLITCGIFKAVFLV